MTFNKGSLILLDYTAKIKDTGEVFETTIEDKACLLYTSDAADE